MLATIIMRITHQQIADKVGVSRTVVTHVLHRTPHTRISEQTRREILNVAAALGYEPRNRATYNIGYVMSPSQMKLDAEISQVMHLEKMLRERGYRLTLASWQADDPLRLKEIFNTKTVDAIIFNTWSEGLIQKIPSAQMPWILLSDEDGVDTGVDLIAVDAIQTAKNLALHLIGRGHTRLGLVVGLPEIKFHRSIIEGTRQAMLESGIKPESLQIVRPYYVEELAADLLPMMAAAGAPTAIVTATPGIGITTLYSLRCAGYQIPDEVSVAALLDHERYAALPPVLTSTDALGTEFLEKVATRVIEKIHNRQTPSQQIHIAGNVLERQSVASPPALPLAKAQILERKP